MATAAAAGEPRAGGVSPMGTDPVLARRRKVARYVQLGQRVGYLAFGVAIVLFVVGFAVGFTDLLTSAVLFSMVIACVVLPPAIVFGYGVKAADRHEAEERRDAALRRDAGHHRQPPPGNEP